MMMRLLLTTRDAGVALIGLVLLMACVLPPVLVIVTEQHPGYCCQRSPADGADHSR
jgi:hypothetical protein